MKISNTLIIRWLTKALPVPLTAAGMLAFAPVIADEAAADREEAAGVDTSETQPESGPGLAGNVHFTDEDGNRREPTAAEILEVAQAFQRDLARLAGKHRGKPNERTLPDGTVAATIAPSKLVLLTVRQTEDGELHYGHAAMDEDGNVSFGPGDGLPEK